MKSWNWLLLILFTILIKWVSLYPDWVEKNYTYGIYPTISKALRILFGWLPFSIGDLFYTFLGLVIIFRVVKFFRLLFRKQLTRGYFGMALQQGIFFFLLIYVSFNLLWGLNYNRRGVAHQLGLEVKKYSNSDIDTLCVYLQSKLNFYAGKVDTVYREDYFSKRKNIFNETSAAYLLTKEKFSFLTYEVQSLKPSLVGFLGRYFGFQGYYNPFTGEGQVKSSIPLFIQPFVSCHEVAHQLGYAKENEANFAGWLACRESSAVDFRYSAYFDMYQYAIGELYMIDRRRGVSLDSSLHPLVWRDRKEYAQYARKMQNPVAPFMIKMYDGYLKMNNQPKGYRTYNEVVTWLVAYYKKYGKEAL